MKKFNDERKELKELSPGVFYTLEIVGKLMAVRTKKNISQRKLSELSGVPQKTISRIESGIDSPKLETIGKLAAALQMEIILVSEQANETHL